MFYSGQKVVCVNARASRPGFCWGADEVLTEGVVYTVLKSFINSRGRPCLHLVEKSRDEETRRQLGADAGYAPWRFRPLSERPTSIEVFKRLLVPSVLPTKERT